MAPVTPRWESWKFENYQKWSRGVLPSWQSPPNDQNHWFRLRLRSKRTKIAILPLFSIVFYSKTIGKQKKLSEWVSPERSRAEIWHKAFLYSVDSNCKRFLETYFFDIKVTRYRSCGSDRFDQREKNSNQRTKEKQPMEIKTTNGKKNNQRTK